MDAVFAEEKKGDRKKMIEKFVSLFLPGTYHELSLNNDVLNFYHHDTSVRLSAVKSLKSTIIDGRGTSSPHHSYDDNFFSSVLLSRLSDDEPTVVKAVLDMGEEVLLKHVDKTELLNSLQKISHHKSQNW
ncbi:PREDICTED: HEAT repeat-containing protein 1-like [Amphimedon queenslandica]|nr:PREDICTED: HEAT repeat-containing protein 1-like [Amphimedon queenslandica]|eukprot:XP_019857689.1 PREDICTED: HEAT repeat-containing protein 1-like [Amphimedon queenslandica]